jgi:O-antigen/teichoic acid export membrane protein
VAELAPLRTTRAGLRRDPPAAPASPEPADGGHPGVRKVRTARSILLLTVAEVIGKLGTLVVVIGAARVLPLADFGVFSVALGLGAMAAVLPSWGLDTVLIQRGAREPATLPGLLGTLLVLRWIVGAGLVALMAAGAAVAGLPARITVAAGAVITACLVETATEAYKSVAVARESPAVVAGVQLAQRTVTAVLTLLALGVWGTLLAVSIAYLAGTLVGTVGMAAGAARLGVRPGWQQVGRVRTGRLLRVSWPTGVHSVVSMALFRIDAVLLAALAGATAAGRYAAAFRLLETVVFVSWTVARAVFPIMAATPVPRRVRRVAEAGLAVLATVFLPYAVLLWCRGPDVLRLLYGPGFARESAAALAWLAPAPLLFGAGYLAGLVVLAGGPTPRLLVGSLGALAVNLGLNLALIPRYGPVGAAVSTSVSYAVQVLLLYPAVRRQAGRPALVRPLLPATGASAVAAAALLLPVSLLPAGAAAAAGFAGSWLLLARWLDPEQVGVLRGLLRPQRSARRSPRHARATGRRRAVRRPV